MNGTKGMPSVTAQHSAPEPRPPIAPVREVSDTYFGTSVTDPYRWMETTSSLEFQNWLKAQDTFARDSLGRISGREKLFLRTMELAKGTTIVRDVERVGRRYFYLSRHAGTEAWRLCVREGLSGAERVLVDPSNAAVGGEYASIDHFAASRDGKHVAYGVSLKGSEDSVLSVVDTDTGRILSERIDRTQLATVSWLPDHQSFFYTRLAKLEPGAPANARYKRMRTNLHRLGSDPESDRSVLGFGVTSTAPTGEDDFSYVAAALDSPYVVGWIRHGMRPDWSLYVASRDALLKGEVAWRKLAGVDDAVMRFAFRGTELFALSRVNAPHAKVVRVDLARGTLSGAVTVVAESEGILQEVAAASDALYVVDLVGGINRLRRVPYAHPEKATVLSLPLKGSIPQVHADATVPGVMFEGQSWVNSMRWFEYLPNEDRVADTGIAPPSPADYSEIEAEEVSVASADGTQVPLSIIHRRGIPRDGTAPTWLIGYGAYGNALSPYFAPMWLTWLERGGVFAVAHVRGGGEFGEAWHRGGMKESKENSVSDFIACAEYLVDRRYTASSRLVAVGPSAGAVVIGGAIARKPSLFGSAIIEVGWCNPLRYDSFAAGPSNVAEFGDHTTEQGFKALLAMDPYHRVRALQPYPAVLFTAGANDVRVPPWQPGKMAARLQASTTSGKPVLVRVDFEAGHGQGTTNTQRAHLVADEYAFSLWQMGDPDFRSVR